MPIAEWINRETQRFLTGHYKPLPEPIKAKLTVPPTDPRHTHFPHISKDDPALMAYTQSPDKGQRDIKTKIKPGAYLKRFFADKLSPPEIASLANVYRTVALPDDTQLIIATTPDECIAAYRACTGSCFSYSNGGYVGPQHPAAVYGSPDPAYATVAYLKRQDRITAKALVNRQTLKAQSFHGDSTTLKVRLNALGYNTDGTYCLMGLRLNAIPTELRTSDGRIRFVAPGIDGHIHARHDAALPALTLVTAAEYNTLPKEQKVSLGYYQGLSS